jgi:hypothetical protein
VVEVDDLGVGIIGVGVEHRFTAPRPTELSHHDVAEHLVDERRLA